MYVGFVEGARVRMIENVMFDSAFLIFFYSSESAAEEGFYLTQDAGFYFERNLQVLLSNVICVLYSYIPSYIRI